MDIDDVWDGLYIYSLLLDHAERDAVLYLDHNAASQVKRIHPALQARNRRMRGTGQEEWSPRRCRFAGVDPEKTRSASMVAWQVLQCIAGVINGSVSRQWST
jgi:hypothetical protein